MTYTPEQLIEQHIFLRRLRDEGEKAWGEKKGQINKAIQSIEGVLATMLLAADGKPIQTSVGTAYQRQMTFCAVADIEALRSYIRQSGDLGILKWNTQTGIDREAVEKYMAANHGQEPPGVRTTRIIQTLTREPQ